MSTAEDLRTIAAICAAVIGIAGIAGVVLVYARQTAMNATVTFLTTANAELRAEVKDGRDALDVERRLCGERTAHLEGQLAALTGTFAHQILEAVHQTSDEAIRAATIASAAAATSAAHLKEMTP